MLQHLRSVGSASAGMHRSSKEQNLRVASKRTSFRSVLLRIAMASLANITLSLTILTNSGKCHEYHSLETAMLISTQCAHAGESSPHAHGEGVEVLVHLIDQSNCLDDVLVRAVYVELDT